MADPKGGLGSTEIDILRYVGDHHPISVGEVAEHMAQSSGQARTTVLTIMERLRRKGHLTRRRVEGVYRYSPKVPKDDLLLGLVQNFVHTTLGGSVSPFVAFLAGNESLSDEELAALKRLVQELEQQRREARR
jgi:predicted transcriptional regulator